MKTKFYVVVKGRKIGIFDIWDEGAKQYVEGYKGAVYKSFSKIELAEMWWEQMLPESKSPIFHFDTAKYTVQNYSSPMEDEEPGPYFTYLIIDPRTNIPFYVGQTCNIEYRKINHLKDSHKYRAYKKMISNIQMDNLEPEFQIVDIQPTKTDSLRSETEWVKKLAYQGIRVLNGWREHKEWIDLIMSSSTQESITQQATE
ncbi:RNase H1/viroplasmin domain-containing protein [Paenibacillus odorifer]|uniref:RNase H1/viroplasmin domain-containing protein n=1 Tax=Paenibacillus TaxID=44249 RepID=UPI00096F7EC4|nr:RNase H1/viroplasmin domain-containing protein [Paenibacillus odorifer]OMC92078.1 hypothetical protein BJP46_09760 [Paenibacillus odorifer]OME26403.1 hypothetical protein BSK57_08940 [Paenibacillus odorifer]